MSRNKEVASKSFVVLDNALRDPLRGYAFATELQDLLARSISVKTVCLNWADFLFLKNSGFSDVKYVAPSGAIETNIILDPQPPRQARISKSYWFFYTTFRKILKLRSEFKFLEALIDPFLGVIYELQQSGQLKRRLKKSPLGPLLRFLWRLGPLKLLVLVISPRSYLRFYRVCRRTITRYLGISDETTIPSANGLEDLHFITDGRRSALAKIFAEEEKSSVQWVGGAHAGKIFFNELQSVWLSQAPWMPKESWSTLSWSKKLDVGAGKKLLVLTGLEGAQLDHLAVWLQSHVREKFINLEILPPNSHEANRNFIGAYNKLLQLPRQSVTVLSQAVNLKDLADKLQSYQSIVRLPVDALGVAQNESDSFCPQFGSVLDYNQICEKFSGEWPSKLEPNEIRTGSSANFPKKILYICFADPLVRRTGSTNLILNHLNFFEQRGCQVFLLAIAHDLVYPERVLTDSRVNEFKHDFFDIIYPEFSDSGKDSMKAFFELQYLESCLERDMAIFSKFNVRSDLLEKIDLFSPDLVFSNYITTFPLADIWAKRFNIPHVCETFDLQSFQYGHSKGQVVKAEDITTEMSYLSQVDAVAMISDLERSKVLDWLPESKAHFVPQYLKVDELPRLSTYKTSSVESLRRESGASYAVGNEEFIKLEHLGGSQEAFDFLYLSSFHPPNIRSLMWFKEEVYEPFLKDLGIKFIIAGSVCEGVSKCGFSKDFVFLGEVKDVVPLYLASKAILLPIVEGAGLAIKTIEAFTLGKASVATPLALRGFPPEARKYPSFQEPADFANEIIRVHRDVGYRQQLAKTSREIVKNNFNRHLHHQAMDRLIAEALRGHKGPISLFRQDHG